MNNTSPNKFNIVIAILSIAIGIIYFFSTIPSFIEQLECSNCGTVRDMSFMHYWYRWVLASLLLVAGMRLFKHFKGTRRMFCVFFAGLLLVSIHDLVKELPNLAMREIVPYTILPMVISVLGFIYFSSFYKSSLKRS